MQLGNLLAPAPDDVVLVRRCLRGEVNALTGLLQAFQGDVFGLCVRLLRDRHEAEDVTQEVFLRVFRSLHRWDSTRPLKPWIMGIAINRCRTWLTRRARRPQAVDFLQENLADRPTDDSREMIQEIQGAVADLRYEYRTVFTLFHEQGEPYEVIAAMLGRPVGTIKTWLHRARIEVLDRLRSRGMVTDESGYPAAGKLVL